MRVNEVSSYCEATLGRLASLLKAQDAVLIAHYYTDSAIQQLAEETQGFVGDSLSMARFGCKNSATTLMVAGVRFMGESAKILNPQKRVLMPTLEATCSLDLGCPAEAFSKFCKAHDDRTVVVYCNTSAAVIAQSDWVVTSANAVSIIDHLDSQGEKILWAPDRYLGHYLQKKTGADMVLWQGSCIVHEEFKTEALAQLRKKYPDAAVLAHPESPPGVCDQADVVGSTSVLLKASHELPNNTLIVATDQGIVYQMQKLSLNKTFIPAPTAGSTASCHSCGHCPWMAMNTLETLERSLLLGDNEITIPEELLEKARVPLERMIHFNA